MNNAQLQQAIDSSREFLKVTGTAGGPLYGARENTQKTLKELEALQVIRAGLMTKPSGQLVGK
jgi:hypothetical protein